MTLDHIRNYRLPVYPDINYIEKGAEVLPPTPQAGSVSIGELLSKVWLELFNSRRTGYVKIGQRHRLDSTRNWYEAIEAPVSDILTSHSHLSGLLVAIKRKLNPDYGIDEYSDYN